MTGDDGPRDRRQRLATCVACGLCLPHCPTFRATGEEARSPRGRIDAMRAVQWRGRRFDDDFVEIIETCVQCRGCEPACPSGVPFGRLIEGTREELAGERTITPRWQRLAFSMLPRHRPLLAGSTRWRWRNDCGWRRAGWVCRGSRCGGPAVSVHRLDVWLFTGCVMDAWQRDTHRNTATCSTRPRRDLRHPGSGACCGALHTHAGLHDEASAGAARDGVDAW